MIEAVTKSSPKTGTEPAKEAVVRVLHVDDDDDFLVISKRLLERQGSLKVESATSVKTALQKLRQKSFDAIVSDYQMFGKTGLEFFSEIRADENDAPFFLLTGEQREEIARYEANLLNGFWSKKRYYGFLNTFKYEKEKVVLDKYTIIEATRTRTIYNWLQYFSPVALEKEFVEGGFSIEKLYSDVAGSPFEQENLEFAVVAKKQ